MSARNQTASADQQLAPNVVKRLAEISAECAQANESILSMMRSTLERAAAAGRLLIEAKDLLPHGQFRAWCEANTPYKHNRCAQFMRLAKCNQLETFDAGTSVDAALRMLPAPARAGGNKRPPPPVPAPSAGMDDLPPVVAPLEPPPPVPVDQLGAPLTTPEMIQAFSRRHEVAAACKAVSDAKTTVLARIEADDPLYADVSATRLQADLNNARDNIASAKPYAVCPYCGGGPDGCKACRARGWVNKATYEHAPPEVKPAERVTTDTAA